MLNQESLDQLKERKKIKSALIYELEPIEARNQFNKSKLFFPTKNISIKSIENKNINVNGTKINKKVIIN